MSARASIHDLAGKVALVTGGSRGIGAEIARRLARDGASLIVNYASNQSRAEEVVETIVSAGGQATAIGGDITDLAAIERLFDTVRERHGRVDILVNNAGRGSHGFPTHDRITPEDYDAMFALNTRAAFFVTQHATRIMPDGGRVISISSMASRIRHAGLSTYSASKAALDAFTRILAMELAPRGITINSVQSGIVATEMTAQIEPSRRAELIGMIPMGRIGEASDIADVVAFLASEASRWITGHEIPVSGGRYI